MRRPRSPRASAAVLIFTILVVTAGLAKIALAPGAPEPVRLGMAAMWLVVVVPALVVLVSLLRSGRR